MNISAAGSASIDPLSQIPSVIGDEMKDFKDEKIEKVASEFESVFLSMMLKEMRNTLDQEEGGLFGGEGSDSFGGMFDLFMGQHLAETQPLGIADAIKGYLGQTPDQDPEQNPPTDQSVDQDKSK